MHNDLSSKGYEYGDDLISATVGLEMTEINVQYNKNNIVVVFETATVLLIMQTLMLG